MSYQMGMLFVSRKLLTLVEVMKSANWTLYLELTILVDKLGYGRVLHWLAFILVSQCNFPTSNLLFLLKKYKYHLNLLNK